MGFRVQGLGLKIPRAFPTTDPQALQLPASSGIILGLGLQWGYIGIMEKKTETTIINGLYLGRFREKVFHNPYAQKRLYSHLYNL